MYMCYRPTCQRLPIEKGWMGDTHIRGHSSIISYTFRRKNIYKGGRGGEKNWVTLWEMRR